MDQIQYCGSTELCTLPKCKLLGCILNNPYAKRMIEFIHKERSGDSIEKVQKQELKELRKSIIVSVNPTCWYCGIELDFMTITRDHVVPKSKGGSNKKSNIVICCSNCNRTKASLDYYEFLERAARLGVTLRPERMTQLAKRRISLSESNSQPTTQGKQR